MYEFFTAVPPSYVAMVAVVFLMLGVILGFGLCAIRISGSNAEDEMDRAFAVSYRYRCGESAKWVYTEDPKELDLVPAHWQVQSLALIRYLG